MTSSRSQWSGDAASVKPTLMSITISAGFLPNPARPWKPSSFTRAPPVTASGWQRRRTRGPSPHVLTSASTSAASFRLRHLTVAVLADAAKRVLTRLHRRPGERLRRHRRLEPRLLLRAGDDLLVRRPHVEVEHLASHCAQPLAQLLGRGRVADDDAVVGLRLLCRDEPLGDVRLDLLGRPVERVLPAAAARRAVDEHVTRLDLDLVALGRQPLPRSALAEQDVLGV